MQNKKLHKFFDDSYDSFLDFPESEMEAAFHSSTSRTLASTKRTTAPKYEEEKENEEVHNSVNGQESKESRNSSDLLQDTKKESTGMKQLHAY